MIRSGSLKLIVALGCLLCSFGCNRRAEQSSSAASSSSVSSSQAARGGESGSAQEPAPQRTLTVLAPSDAVETSILLKHLAEFQAQTGLSVTISQLPYQELRGRELQSFAKPEAEFDVVYVDGTWVPEYAKGDYLQKLLSLADRDAFPIEDFTSPTLRSVALFNHYVWLVPVRADVQVLFYNKAIFENPALQQAFAAKTGLQLAVPALWSAYPDVARGLTGLEFGGLRLSGAIEALKPPYASFEAYVSRYVALAHQDFLDQNGRPAFNNRFGAEALAQMRTQTAALPPESFSSDAAQAAAVFSSGRTAMAILWYSQLPQLLSTPGGLTAEQIGIARVPGVPGSGNIQGSISTPMIRGGGYAIATNSRKREDAWTFIQFAAGRALAKEYALAGSLVPRKSILTDPEVLEKIPATTVLRQSLFLGFSTPRAEDYLAVEAAIGEAVSKVLSGKGEPEAELQKAEAMVKLILDTPH